MTAKRIRMRSERSCRRGCFFPRVGKPGIKFSNHWKRTLVLTVLSFHIGLSCVYSVDDLNFRGDFNAWGTTAMTKTGGVFRVTIQETTTGYRRFKFDEDGTWDPDWGNGDAVSIGHIDTLYANGANGSNLVQDTCYYTYGVLNPTAEADSQNVVQETTNAPISISTVTDNHLSAGTNTVTVTIQTSAEPSGELLFVRYTTNSWSASAFAQASGSDTNWSSEIPALSPETHVDYYILTTTFSSPTHSDADLQTIAYGNNGGANYSYTTPIARYVDASRPDNSGDGYSWATAKQTIQAAADISNDGDTIWVTNGIYNLGSRPMPGYTCSNRVVITNAITLQSVNGPEVTIIEGAPDSNGGSPTNGPASIRGVYMVNATLSGFTITNGWAMDGWSTVNGPDREGGGVWMTNSVVTNCVITGCRAYGAGGAILAKYDCEIRNCDIYGNVATNGGAGGVQISTDCLMQDCHIYENYAASIGGGVYVGPASTANNCIIERNRAAPSVIMDPMGAGGMLVQGTANNCLVVSNSTTAKGGGATIFGTGHINNCTLVGNSADVDAGGVFFYNATLGELANSIVWDNTSPTNTFYWSTAAYITNCCAPGGVTNGVNGCTTNDPAFADHYRLTKDSPCFNTGANILAPTNASPDDLAGNDRIMFGTVDMGAYELSYQLSSYAGPADGGNTITVTNSHLGNGSDITNVTVSDSTATIEDQGSNWVTITLGPAVNNDTRGDILIQSASVGDTTFAGVYSYNPKGFIGNETGWLDTAGLPVVLDTGNAVVYSNRLYSIGGTVAGASSTNVYRFDGTNWNPIAGLPGPRRAMGCVVYDGLLYAIGGIDASSVQYTNVYTFDGTSWSETAGLPYAVCEMGCAVWNGKIYCIAGGGGGSEIASVCSFDGSSWTMETSLPGARTAIQAQTLNGTLYALGGYDGAPYTNVWTYDGSAWSEVPGYPIACCAMGTTVREGLIYSMGGMSGPHLTNCWTFDGSTWTEIEGLPRTLYAPAGATYNGQVYCVGGHNSGSGTTNVLTYPSYTGGVSPVNGSVNGGVQVTINGVNLGNGSDITNVTLCGVEVTSIDSQSATQVVVTAAAGTPGDGDVCVYSTAYGKTTKTKAFAYYQLSVPTGPYAGGNSITITNGTLGDGADITNVTVDGVSATITGQGVNWVTITLPEATASGTVDVLVQSVSVGDTLLTDAYTYNPAGQIGLVVEDWSLWQPVDGTPSAMTYGGAGILDNDLFVAGGVRGYSSAATNAASFDGEDWTLEPVHPLQATDFGATIYSGAFYTVAGHAGLSYITNVVYFDGSSWSETAGLPEALGMLGAGVLDGYLYSVGGTDGSANNARTNVFRFDGSAWTEVAGLPQARRGLGVATFNGALYALGGQEDGSSTAHTNVYRFDGSSWTEVAGLPQAKSSFAVSTLRGKLYVIAGLVGFNGATTVHCYDGTNWMTATNYPAAVYGLSAAELDGYLYGVSGTTDDYFDYLTNAYRYPWRDVDPGVDPNTGSWTGDYQVVITGSNLGDGSDITNVTLCGVNVDSIDSQSSTQVVVTAGQATIAGAGDVRVYSTSYGESIKSNAFEYLREQQDTLIFTPASPQAYLATNALSTSGGSGTGAVSYAVLSGPGTIVDSTNLTVTAGSGTIEISATKAQDDRYFETIVTGTVSAAKANASITWSDLLQTYDGTAKSPTRQTSPTGLTVELTFDGNAWAPTNVGTYAVTGTINDADYQGSSNILFTINQATATVYLADLAQTYDGTARSVTATSDPSGLTVEFTYDGNAWAPTNAGSYAITGTINDANYQGFATGTLVVDKANQTISAFLPTNDSVFAWLDPVGLSAVGGGSGNPVTFAVADGPGQISGATNLGFTGVGAVQVTANQAGNANYNAAPPLTNHYMAQMATATYYVDAARPDDSGLGLSWATAKRTIQAAVDLAANGSTVWVTNGIYSEGGMLTPGYALTNRVTVTQSITLQSMNGAAFTTIEGAADTSGGSPSNGPAAVRCVFLGTNAQLTGFTLTNGHTLATGEDYYEQSAAGVFLQTNAVVRDCIMAGNEASYAAGGAGCFGGGAIVNCIIRDNYADYGAGGAGCYHGGSINNCAIYENVSFEYAGGLYLYAVGELNNCTIARNAAFSAGGGVLLDSGGTINNCIVWSNLAPMGINIMNNGGTAVRYTCSPDGVSQGVDGCTTNNPLFADMMANDFTIRSASPAVNAGNDIYAPTNVATTDLAGQLRIAFGSVDLGAYERQFFVSAEQGPWHGGNSLTLTNNTVLGNGVDITNVTICGAEALITAQGDTWVTVTLGEGPTDGVTGDIIVQSTSLGGTVLSNAYTYNPAGVIRSTYKDWTSWMEVAGLPAPRHSVGVVTLGDYLYAMGGGEDGSTGKDTVFRFDGATWTELGASLPAADLFPTVATMTGTVFYFRNQAYTNTETYSFDGNTWERVPGGEASVGYYRDTAENLGTNIYVMGGFSGNSTTNVFRFDGSTLGASVGLPARREAGASAALNSNLYFLGGFYNTAQTNVYRFDGSNWAEMTGLPAPRYAVGAAMMGEHIYVVGGNSTHSTTHTNVFLFDGTNWMETVGLPANRGRIGVGEFNGLLYAVGGVTESYSAQTNVFYYPALRAGPGVFPQTGSWTGNYPVIITGSNLCNGTDVTNVTLCGVNVDSIDSQSATQVIVMAASASFTGTGDVRIYSISFGESIKSNAFEYTRELQAALIFTPTTPQTYLTTNALSTSGGSGTGIVSYAMVSGPGQIVGTTNLAVTSGTGTIEVSATKAQDDLYYESIVTGTVIAVKASANVYLADLAQTYDGTARSVTATSDPSGLTIEFTYDGDAWAPTNAGSYAVTGSINGINYEGSATDTLVVDKANQVTTFPPLNDQFWTNVVGLSATADSGLAISFGVLSGPASISDDTNLSFTGYGSVSITADQAGDDNWNAAPTVTNKFSILGPEITLLGTNEGVIVSEEAPNIAKGTEFPRTMWHYPAFTNVFTITNSGTADLHIEGVTTNGSEYFRVVSWPTTVATQSTGNLVIAADPLTINTHTARVELAFNGTNSPFALNLELTVDPDVMSIGLPTQIVNDVERNIFDRDSWTVLQALTDLRDIVNQTNLTNIIVRFGGWPGYNPAFTNGDTARLETDLDYLLDTFPLAPTVFTNGIAVGEKSFIDQYGNYFTTDEPHLFEPLPYTNTYTLILEAGRHTAAAGIAQVLENVELVTRNNRIQIQASDNTQTQAIDFAALSDQLETNTTALSATASSGLDVSFRVDAGPAVLADAISPTTMTYTNYGMATIVAAQTGDVAYLPALEISNSFRVYGVFTVTVASTHGTATPAPGAYLYVEESIITNMIATPDTQDTTQYVCGGWAMTGNEPLSGPGTNCIMTVTNDALLTWQWSTNYWLAVSAITNGYVDAASGWFGFGTPLMITGTASNYYHFDQWTVIPGGANTNNPLNLTIDQPYGLVSAFDENVTTNTGTPEWWLASFGLTNFAPDAIGDNDSDGVPTWEEYIADTIPTNPASLLQIDAIGMGLGNRRVEWIGGTGVLQYLEWTTSANDGSAWTIISTNTPPTPVTNQVDVYESQSEGFYRIRAVR